MTKNCNTHKCCNYVLYNKNMFFPNNLMWQYPNILHILHILNISHILPKGSSVAVKDSMAPISSKPSYYANQVPTPPNISSMYDECFNGFSPGTYLHHVISSPILYHITSQPLYMWIKGWQETILTRNNHHQAWPQTIHTRNIHLHHLHFTLLSCLHCSLQTSLAQSVIILYSSVYGNVVSILYVDEWFMLTTKMFNNSLVLHLFLELLPWPYYIIWF